MCVWELSEKGRLPALQHPIARFWCGEEDLCLDSGLKFVWSAVFLYFRS